VVVPLVAALEQDWDPVRPIGEGDSQPAPSPSGFLSASSVQETDLHPPAGSGTWYPTRSLADSHAVATVRGAVLAPAGKGTGEKGDVFRILPTSVTQLPASFTLRGELMHAFLSYRVATEGMVLQLHQSSSYTPCPAPFTSPHRAPLIPHLLWLRRVLGQRAG
jgi:hypothetical protein